MMDAKLNLAAVLMGGLLWLGQANAALSLQETRRLATTDEPGQMRLGYQARALDQQAEAAAQLPDPKLKFGLVNLATDSFDFEQEAMTQLLVGINQAFPKGDSLAYRADMLKARAGGVDQESRGRQLQVGLQAQKAWLETYYWEQAGAIVTKNRGLFEQLVKVTESLFSVGRKSESDLIRAQLELSRLELRLVAIAQKTRQNRALLAQWVGQERAHEPLAPLDEEAALPTLLQLEQRLENHPKLSALAALIEADKSAERLAGEQYKPGFGVDLSYGYRGDDRVDLASLVVTLDMPLFGRGKQDALQRAAIGSTQARRAVRVETYRQLKRELQVEYSRHQELSEQLALFEDRLLPQVRQQSKATLNAYENDRGDFSDLMRAYMGELTAELDHRRLRVDQGLARVTLASLTGDTL